jgi:Secretion system C-terminal sorting domain/Peptidase family C25
MKFHHIIITIIFIILFVKIGKCDSNDSESTKMLVVVESELFNEIHFYIDRYIIEVTGEGFEPELYLFESGDHVDLRQILAQKYELGMEGCIMVGNLPIAYYHTVDCNSHQPSEEVFPCDLFYMDLDGEFTDTDNDGDYDEHTGDVKPEIWFGRLYTNSLVFGNYAETEHMIRYFNKNHLYRSELATLPERSMLYIDDDFHNHDDFYGALSQAYDSIVLFEDDAITSEEHYKEVIPEGYELMHVSVHGYPYAHTFIQPSGSYSNLTSNEIIQCDPKSHFIILYGCSNAKYTFNNCLANWYTFHEDYIVASLGSGKSGSQLFYTDLYTPFGQGLTIGEAFRDWFITHAEDGLEQWERCCYGGLTILGDPTLKMQKFQSNNEINIIPETIDTAYSGESFSYEIKTDVAITSDIQFELIAGELPNGIHLVDNEISGKPFSSDVGDFVFTIKVFNQNTPNAFDIQHFSINVEYREEFTSIENDLLAKNKIGIFPNPFSNELHISTQVNFNNLEIKLFDSKGSLHYETKKENLSKKESISIPSYVLSELKPGIYFISTNSDNVKLHKKVIKQK